MKYLRFIETTGGWARFQELLEELGHLAKNKNTSIASLATAYIMNQPAVGAVIVGARLGESQHIDETLKVFDLELLPNDYAQIKSALTGLNSVPGDCGDEYRKPPFLTASGDLSHHLSNFPMPYPVQVVHSTRSKALSGTVWEDIAGFSRAVRNGDRILVSGTTATHGSRAIGIGNPAVQTHFIIDKIEGALQSLGGKLEHVVRTRIFIRNVEDWEVIARVHGDRFRAIQPANTMVRADLIGEEYLVEMEAEAVVDN